MLIKRVRVAIGFCAAAFFGLSASGFYAAAAPNYYAGWTVGDARDGYGTILRSTDSGETWARQGAGQIANVSMCAVSTVDPYTAWVVGDSDGYATIYHTTDGGKTWVRKGSPSDVPDVNLIKVHASDDDHVWAVGQGTILHTGNRGSTWTNQIPSGYEQVPLQGVYAPDSSTVWVTGGPQDGYPTVLKSTDAGLSWSRQSGGDIATPGYDHVLGISAVDTETAWLIGGDDTSMGWFVLNTTDGGDTWIEQTKGALDGNNVCAVDSSTVWAVSDTSINRTIDGGSTWSTHNSSYYTMGISAVNSLEAWAITSGLSGSIRHTTDGGINWTVLTELGGETIPSLGTVSFSNQPVPAYPVIESGDYDGDGKAEIAVFRPGNGLWAVRGLGRTYFGATGDVPVSGDYNGDGYSDVSVFRPSSGLWAVKGITRLYFGGSDDTPVPADYDGDGSCDIGLFRDDSGLWSVRGVTRVYCGAGGDYPVPGDYDNDGTADIATFRPSAGLWAVAGITRCYFGGASDLPVPGNFTWYSSSSKSGFFRSQIAVFRPSTGLWAIRGCTRFYFGSAGDMPVVGDFDGNALDDTAVFRPTGSLWAIKEVSRTYFGAYGDFPVTR